jgi:choline-sulfatase
MNGRNMLVLMSDEHQREALGCYGHPIVRTPNLDKLAEKGVRFTNAYTPSPICVPARASFATGRYVHDTRHWTNAQPYDGSISGWGHRLMEEGCHVASVGKLHYRSDTDPNGFSEEILPMHVRGGIGWSRGLLRGENQSWDKAHEFIMTDACVMLPVIGFGGKHLNTRMRLGRCSLALPVRIIR